MKKRTLLFFCFILMMSFLISQSVFANLLLDENFDYSTGNLNGTGDWSKHSGTANQVQITAGNLTFTSYTSSGVGNKVTMSSSYTEDLSKSLGSTLNSGSLYTSFLVKFSDVSTNDYEFHFIQSSGAHKGKFFSQKIEGNLKFGVSIYGNGVMASANYSFNTTYLVILKITFQEGNEEIKMWVEDSSVPSSESAAGSADAVATDNEITNITKIALRNGDADFDIDGIRIGTSWGDAPLPVTLSTFTAQYLNNVPILYWVTQSETDNIGWYVYRNTQNDFINSMIISDLIPGYGTTTEPHSYIYEDHIENVFPGDTYWYWLESIDFGGMINHYDKVAHIVIPENYDPGNENSEEFEEFGLFHSNPNPFNPKTEEATEISFNLKEQAYVEINIYNIKGELVKTIYDGFNTADEAVWDGKDVNGNLQATGIYLYELKVNNKLYSTKRMIMIR